MNNRGEATLGIMAVFLVVFAIAGIESSRFDRARRESTAREDHSEINIAVFPFEGDRYGVTDAMISRFRKEGFTVVERGQIYRIFDEMKLQMSGITDYEAVKTGKILNAEFIVLGTAYMIERKANYIPKSNNNTNAGAFTNGFSDGWNIVSAMSAGTYVYGSYRMISVVTGEVVSSKHNIKIKKY